MLPTLPDLLCWASEQAELHFFGGQDKRFLLLSVACSMAIASAQLAELTWVAPCSLLSAGLLSLPGLRLRLTAKLAAQLLLAGLSMLFRGSECTHRIRQCLGLQDLPETALRLGLEQVEWPLMLVFHDFR